MSTAEWLEKRRGEPERRSASLVVRIALLILALAHPAQSLAVEPIMYSDAELAKWPIVVVGYWPTAKIVPHVHDRYDVYLHDKVIDRSEAKTSLVITRVLHGDVAAGYRYQPLTAIISGSFAGNGHGHGPDHFIGGCPVKSFECVAERTIDFP